MPLVRQGQPRPDEGNEFLLSGPFGGVQSEAPVSRIEGLGVYDAVNVLFRKGAMQVRPQLFDTPNVGNPVVGIADFFDVQGSRHQVVITTSSLYTWTPPTWTNITGTPLHGGNPPAAPLKFSTTVVANQLLFDQGVDPIQAWNGITTTFGPPVSPSGETGQVIPVCRYLFELNTYALALYTTETVSGASTQFTQRVRWSAPGDPGIWTGSATEFRPGVADLFNDLGPFTGGVKLYQSGFIFQYWGITQVVPTGIGTSPFEFVPLSSRAKGNVIPFSLSNFGEDIACYVGKDNVYQFDGNYSIPIGDARVDGTRYRIGARRRILADLLHADFTTVNGFITTSINGNDYFAYWLFIPSLNMAWVYHFDEQSWSRETFAQPPLSSGNFFSGFGVTIAALIGPISAQQWSPATLLAGSPFDALLIGGQDGTPRYIDFTGASERAWTVQSGNHYFGDFRRKKTVTAVRLCIQDLVPSQSALLTLVNNKGYSQSQPVGPVGTGSNDDITVVIPFQPVVSGTWVRWSLSGTGAPRIMDLQGTIASLSGTIASLTGQGPFYLAELTPLYDIGGQIRAGGVD